MKRYACCQSWLRSILLCSAAILLTACGADTDNDTVSEGVQSPAPISNSSEPFSPQPIPDQAASSSLSSTQTNTPVNSSSSSLVSAPVSSSSSSLGFVDTIQPIAPKFLKQEFVSTSEVQVSWRTATDNVGVVAYRVYRNETLIAQVGQDARKYNDHGLKANADYRYTVRAGDAAGNWSGSSPTLQLKTLSQPVSTPDKAVVVEWHRPNQRENGDYLELDELGGYEIRYKLLTDKTYKSALITDGLTTRFSLGVLSGVFQFEIAVFDSNGLYSEFVPISPL